MIKLKYIIMSLALGSVLTGCQDLDIAPKNILTGNDVYTNDGGITAYMAGLYGRLPMEDFNVSHNGNGLFNWYCARWDQNWTGEAVNAETIGMNTSAVLNKGYWAPGYQVINKANTLIAELPNYAANDPKSEERIAEARFLRAYTYFFLVKHYGGVPLIDQPTTDSLLIPRSSHQACVDFILSDLDYASEHMTKTHINGRANRYAAAAFESRVALYAGSIARYGQNYTYTDERGVQVQGIPAEDANKYFEKAWDAAAKVDEGGYKLYTADYPDKATNFANIFVNADKSDESIFTRQYDLNNNVHNWDVIMSPKRMTTTYGERFDVTLDWVELFDGLNLDPRTGYLKTTDDDGNYIVYNSAHGPFDNAEPRLKGSVMLPGDEFKGVTLDIRSGLIKESVDPSTKIKKFVADDGKTTSQWNTDSWFAANMQMYAGDPLKQTPVTSSTGVKINKAGLDGPCCAAGQRATLTGFYGRKWLNPKMTVAETQLHKSTQTWIDIRYAEVLLNRAEAAVELAQHGVASYAGKDMLTDAMECINKVRERAGATLLTSTAELSEEVPTNVRGTGRNSFVFAPTKGLQIVRVERYKELAFEHKIFWDLRRWFTYDQQIKEYRRRMMAPFLFEKGATVDANGNPAGKYIIDTRVCAFSGGDRLTFEPRFYYDQIPNSERKINPNLTQNKDWK